MTPRSKLLTCLSVLIAALMLSTLGHTPPARADDPPECIGDWPNPDWCFPDILCDAYAEFWDVRRAVVHIYGPDIFGTGVLINNALCDEFGQDCGTPYLLTAHHVVSDQKLPASVDQNYYTSIAPYDSGPDNSIADTVEDSSYYGPGTVKTISAKQEVWLLDGFQADKGSEIVIEVNP